MQTIRTISAFFLALLVLVSSTQFMVGLHFCRGEVQHISLVGKAESCHQEKAVPACHKHKQRSCCQDEIVVHKKADFKSSLEKINLATPLPVDIESPSAPIAEIIPSSDVSRIVYRNYHPPLRSFDLIVEHQVFLI